MRVDFYEMSGRFDDPLEVACILVGKAYPAVDDIAIVGPRETLERLDERLWETPTGRFLPHGIDDGRAPIVLADRAPERTRLLINLDASAPLPAGRYDRVLEIVPPHEDARPRLRRRGTEWTAAGAELHHHRLK